MPQSEPEPGPTSEHHDAEGRDEMNLVEFPFALLRHRGDHRTSIVHEGWITDKDGTRRHQRWVVSGSVHGLPTEYDERVYVALMKLSRDSGFRSRKVPFSVYQVLKIMGSGTGMGEYENVEDALKRLVGVTIFAEGAFWDNAAKKWVNAKTGFHIIERFWLRYRETDEQVADQEGVPAYIVWSEDIWDSIQAGYIKRLNLDFFYSLKGPLARRLYRFLDKRMRYQSEYEIDVFELASRLGMAQYDKPARVREKLQPAFDELIERGFLASAEAVRRGRYTRIRFVLGYGPNRGESAPTQLELLDLDAPLQTYASAQVVALRDRYGTTQREVDLWALVLHQLEGAMTRATYNNWFPRTQLLSLNAGVAVIGVPNEASKEWLGSRLHRVIREAFEYVGERVDEVQFEVIG